MLEFVTPKLVLLNKVNKPLCLLKHTSPEKIIHHDTNPARTTALAKSATSQAWSDLLFLVLMSTTSSTAKQEADSDSRSSEGRGILHLFG
jgi:hypothetical protein